MRDDQHQKVSASHLKRNAYLYIRQSSLRQVFENTESTERQYALRQQAIALGWKIEQVIVIDTDLGQSGASSVDREGFQRLVAEVGLGKAGIVLGLEGESKADLAGELGIAAFSLKNFTANYCDQLAGLDVVLWPDADSPG